MCVLERKGEIEKATMCVRMCASEHVSECEPVSVCVRAFVRVCVGMGGFGWRFLCLQMRTCYAVKLPALGNTFRCASPAAVGSSCLNEQNPFDCMSSGLA